MKENKPRNLKTTDKLWDNIKKSPVMSSLNEQINYFLTKSCREFRKDNPDFDNPEQSVDGKTIKELSQILKDSNIDSYIENMIYKEYLDSHNCEVFMAFNESTALELIKKVPDIQIAIIDYRLPELTGDVLLKQMQEINNSFESIIVTSDIRALNIINTKINRIIIQTRNKVFLL